MTEDDAMKLFETCSNSGRWGADDELGTLNYITDEHRVRAARLVRSGKVVSLAFDLDTKPSVRNKVPVVHRVLLESYDQPTAALDSVEIAPHGFTVTHLDAIAHFFFEGVAYNGRRGSDILSQQGLSFGSVHAVRDGIVTRGVLLDIARGRDVEHLEPGERITPEDLEHAEHLAGVRVARGDALLVRAGVGAKDVYAGPTDPERIAAGLTVDCIPWLHRREVAVYGGDCVEHRPQPYQRLRLPLHMIGMVAMGLVQFDALDLEELSRVAATSGRYEFLFVCAPLRLPGGTGSPVNPLAIF
jgi:kynurenine formamidase